LQELNIQSEDNPKMGQLMKICANMKCNTEYNKQSALLASLINILICNGDYQVALRILKAELPKHYKEFKSVFEKILSTNYWSLDIPSLIHKD
jgi:predicted ATPase